jgi:hypothetical protein
MDAMLYTGSQVHSLAPHIAKSYISTFKLAWVEGSLMFSGHAWARCPVRYPWVYFNHKNSTQIQRNSNMETTINHDLIEDLNSLSSGWRPYSSHFPTMDNHPVHNPAPARPLSCLSKSSISTLTLFLQSSAWSPRHSKTTSRFGISSSRDLFKHDIINQLGKQQEQPCRIGNFDSKQHCSIQIKRVHHPWKRRLTLIKRKFIMWAAFTTSLVEFSHRSTQKDSHN